MAVDYVRLVFELIALGTALYAAGALMVAVRAKAESEFLRSLALLGIVVTIVGRNAQHLGRPASWAVVSLSVWFLLAVVGFERARRDRKRARVRSTD